MSESACKSTFEPLPKTWLIDKLLMDTLTEAGLQTPKKRKLDKEDHRKTIHIIKSRGTRKKQPGVSLSDSFTPLPGRKTFKNWIIKSAQHADQEISSPAVENLFCEIAEEWLKKQPQKVDVTEGLLLRMEMPIDKMLLA
mmetsp:Transcript_3180/g.3525  ORF Transcript_3180/g.3525 Transcript_3180/m.3525 type:complete len:139 (+) Transcript_3180:54-470(+)